MSNLVDHLVSEITAATGAEPPAVLDADAPVPVEEEGEIYFVGLIGGKDVGKTSLVNAIAGTKIAEPTGHGEGTRSVTAYAHASAADAVRRRLGQVDVVTHQTEYLRRQVLLDLPDIDSKYADHVALTRQMLRHMLFPVWVQSVEKYADQRPQMLLKQVAEGNDPTNFIFLLSKVDQLIDREGLQAAGELAEDYSTRLGKVLKLVVSPEVMLVSARRPEDYDMPALRKALGVQRTSKQVAQGRKLATRRRMRSVAEWIEAQDLGSKAGAARRLLDDAGDLVAERLGVPVLEDALPRLERDAAQRMALAEPAVRARLRAWPIVNVLDAITAPLVALVRKNLAPAGGEATSIDIYLAEGGRSIAKNVQVVFAQLNNAYPDFGRLYTHRRLWESPEAESAAADLRRRLQGALDAQKAAVVQRFEPPRWLAPWRWLLTVGAAVWFILVQPMVKILLDMGEFRLWDLLRQAVEILSASMLLTSVGFVLLYLLVLWGVLRFNTYTKVAAWRRRMLRGDGEPPETSLAAQTVEWMQSLLSPLERRHAELADLASRAAHVQEQINVPAAPAKEAKEPATASAAA